MNGLSVERGDGTMYPGKLVVDPSVQTGAAGGGGGSGGSGGPIKVGARVRPDSLYAVTKIFGEALGSHLALTGVFDFVAMRIGWCLYDDPGSERGTGTLYALLRRASGRACRRRRHRSAVPHAATILIVVCAQHLAGWVPASRATPPSCHLPHRAAAAKSDSPPPLFPPPRLPTSSPRIPQSTASTFVPCGSQSATVVATSMRQSTCHQARASPTPEASLCATW